VPLAAAVQTRRPHVAVVGTGAFGGWTALHLRRRGHDVTLLDAYGPTVVCSGSRPVARPGRGTWPEGLRRPASRAACRPAPTKEGVPGVIRAVAAGCECPQGPI